MQAQVDAEARIKQERDNADIREQQLLLQAAENRTTVLEGIKTAGKTVGDGISDFLQDPTKVTASIGLLTGIALGVYTAR
jgi:ATPase family AAA domain-containing protein 3A/B